MPMVLFTFLEHYDWTGKRIIPFCTNEGSGLGLKDGLEIMECQGLTFTQEDSVLKIQVYGAASGSLLLNLRSGGGRDGE